MTKNHIKYIIDTLLLAHISSIAILGFLLGFVIPKGRSRAEAAFGGLHRHDWGDIHLYLSISLLALLTVHLWLNWRWIVQSTKRYFGNQWKVWLWAVSGAWIAVLACAWIIAVVLKN
jgi:hypothetical protein